MFSFSLFFTFWLNLVSPNTTSYGEIYQVVFVQGTIMNQTKNQTIARGGKISANDKVVFKTKDAKAVVISTTRGRFVLEGKKSKQSGSELIAFVNEVISPLKTNSKLSTRAGESDKVLDLEKHFGLTKKGLSQFVVLGDSYTFKYVHKTDSLLALVVHHNDGKKPSVKKIAFVGDSYTLNKNADNVEFIEIQELPIPKPNQKALPGKLRAGFKPLFIQKEELAASFKDYLSTINIDETLKSYMSADGKTSAEEVKEGMDKMSENRKKAEVLFYFIQEGYGEANEEGVIDVNKIKADIHELEKFVKENKL